MIQRKKITEKLTKSAIQYLVHLGYAVNKEFGLSPWGKLRADIFAISSNKNKTNTAIIEVKSCLADFSTDKKYELYLPFCNRMWFIADDWIDQYTEELKQKHIGIIKIHKETGYAYVSSKCKYRKIENKTKKEMIVRLAYKNAEFTKYNTRRERIF